MLLLSTSNFEWYWLHHIFEIIKKAEYDGIDLCIHHNAYDYWDKVYLKKLIDEHNLPIYSLSSPETKINSDKVDDLVEIAEHIWAKIIRFSPPRITDKDTSWFKSYINEKQKRTEVILSVQNVPPKFFLFIIPEYKNSTLDQIKKLTGSVSFDISAIDLSSWIDMIKAQEILWNSIKNTLLSDKKWEKEGLLPGMTHGWVSNLPIESLLMKMKSSGYSGFFTLKVEPSEISVWDLELLYKKLSKFKEYFHKHFTNFK